MNVFKNTVSTNTELYKVKHLIEVKPITFPYGEPTLDKIKNLEIMVDGKCIIDEKVAPDPEGIQVFDPLKQFSANYLGSKLKSRDVRYKDVYEDTVYNPANVSIID
uniref:Vitellogenin n=1 Tax=Ditylenchus dipsaci TaxID=166011 RepID=A0A915EFG8_9BILA